MPKSKDKNALISDNVIKAAEELLDRMLEMLDIEAEAEIIPDTFANEHDDNIEVLKININGEDVGALIGYRGRNLQALQLIFSMVLHNEVKDELEDERIRILIDVSGYREGRQDSLESLAERTRDEALTLEDSIDLPPMSGYDRRIIHAALTKHEDVTTESHGEGRDRHVRVSPVGAELENIDIEADDIDEIKVTDDDE